MDIGPVNKLVPKRQENDQQSFDILLVEDSRSYAELVKATLNARLSCRITHVSTYQEAELMLERKKFFIAVSDIHLPDAGGGGILDLLKRHRLPTIAMTGTFSEATREKAINNGVIDYVLKESAYDIEYICDLIERVQKNMSISILVLDDSPTYRAVFSSMLNTQQLIVYTASDGDEGLALLEQHPEISLALVDYEMPKMNGFTFIRKVRAKLGKDQLALIGISASDQDNLTAHFLKAGANDFIQKPFSHESLICRISQNLEMIERIQDAQDMSYRDFLSGLHNRRYFFQQAEMLHQSAQASHTPLSVMMFDIDHFKRINDDYGHDVGDAVIVEFSELLSQHFKKDLVARVGGEEFAVISQTERATDYLGTVEAFVKQVAQSPVEYGEGSISYTCSVGLVESKHANVENSLKAADLNLYDAKNSGRNQVKYSVLETS